MTPATLILGGKAPIAAVVPRTLQSPIGEDEVDQFALVFGDGPVELVVVGYLEQFGEPDPHPYGSALIMAAIRATASSSLAPKAPPRPDLAARVAVP